MARPFNDIEKPVGLRQRKLNVTNKKTDQEFIISLLGQIKEQDGGKAEPWADGKGPPALKDGSIDKRLADAIFEFQVFWKDQGVFRFPAGVVAPGQNTIQKMVAIVMGMSFTPDPALRFAPEGQMDATACWAACYAWWLKATPGEGGTSQKTQLQIVADGSKDNIWDPASGLVIVDRYLRFLARQHTGLTAAMVPAPQVRDALIRGNVRLRPVILGFSTGPMGGHVNVIHGIDPDKETVSVMECWFPDPDADRTVTKMMVGTMPVYTTRGGNPFKFRGAHVKRPLQFYTRSPLRDGTLLMFPFTAKTD